MGPCFEGSKQLHSHGPSSLWGHIMREANQPVDDQAGSPLVIPRELFDIVLGSLWRMRRV